MHCNVVFPVLMTSLLRLAVSCPKGQFYDDITDSCQECELGYYQDQEGMAYCLPCGNGETTTGKGAASESDCAGEWWIYLLKFIMCRAVLDRTN